MRVVSRPRVGARRRGDELFEAERVVKLGLVQTKTGETRQLWDRGRGEPQVSPSSEAFRLIIDETPMTAAAVVVLCVCLLIRCLFVSDGVHTRFSQKSGQ